MRTYHLSVCVTGLHLKLGTAFTIHFTENFQHDIRPFDVHILVQSPWRSWGELYSYGSSKPGTGSLIICEGGLRWAGRYKESGRTSNSCWRSSPHAGNGGVFAYI